MFLIKGLLYTILIRKVTNFILDLESNPYRLSFILKAF